MRIIFLNLRKQKLKLTVISILLIICTAVSVSISVVQKVYSNELVTASSEVVSDDKIIILDAGHGGEDSGAVGINGVLEKDLNLELVLEIGKIFEEKGYIVVYTRTDDRLLYTEEENIFGIRKISDLKNRCKIAERYPKSLFISIHMNSFGSPKYSGLQVYYSEQNEMSRALASSIQDRVKTDLQHDNNRVIKKGKGIYILDNIENTAILIECGFLTNEEECKKLSEKEYKKQLSFSIVCGIIEHIEKINQS